MGLRGERCPPLKVWGISHRVEVLTCGNVINAAGHLNIKCQATEYL